MNDPTNDAGHEEPKCKREDPREDDPLSKFRTAWLRAIARAWSEPGYREKLLGTNPKEHVDGFPKAWTRLQLEVKEEPDFLWAVDSWTWIDRPKHPKGANGRTDGESEDPGEDELRLYVPLSATFTKPEEMPLALASYYDKRPSIFSDDAPDIGDTKSWLLDTTSSMLHRDPPPRGPVVFLGKGPPKDGLFPNYTNFSALNVALLSAMAKAWVDKNYALRLGQDPESAMRHTRDYTSPWKMAIKVFDDPNVKWANNKWTFTNEKPNVLKLCLPMKPETARDQVLALADYNSAGAEYAFTCCP